MISLYLTPDKTQLVKAKLKKNGILDVEMTKELPSFWSGLAGNDESIPGISDITSASSKNLSSLFKNVRKVTSTKYEEVYIVLPDILFAAVNCYAFVSEEMLKNQVKDSLGVDSFDDFYVVEPFETKAPFAPHKTVDYRCKQVRECVAHFSRTCLALLCTGTRGMADRLSHD